MGFLKSGAIVILTSLLFLSLFLGSIFLTLTWSLEYETIQPEIISISQQLTQDIGIKTQIIDEAPLMQTACEIFPSYQLSKSGIELEIPCEIIKQGTESIIEFGVETIFYQIYYKDYGCSLFECIKDTDDPLTATVFISKEAKDYWKSKFNLTLIITLIILFLLFLLMNEKSNVFINAGVFMILASFLTNQFNWAFNLFPESSLSNFLGLFFTKAHNVFITMLFIGIILIFFGIGMKLFKYGWKISSLSQRKNNLKDDVEEIVEDKLEEQKENNAQQESKEKPSKEKKSNKKKRLTN